MSDDNQQGAGKQALDSDVLAARAAEQRERDAAALAEREYDLVINHKGCHKESLYSD